MTRKLMIYREMKLEAASGLEPENRGSSERSSSGDQAQSILDPYRSVLAAEAFAYHHERVAKTLELYHAETLKRIRAGADVGTATYIEARRQIDQIRLAAPRAFDAVDLCITPTTPVPPFAIAELLGDLATLRSKELLMLRNTRPMNALGLLTTSVPCGFTRAGLPIGMQITGPPWGEERVLRLAHAYERETAWHARRPAGRPAGPPLADALHPGPLTTPLV